MASLHDLPGHLIRRLHQISVSTFTAETAAEGFDLTQVQYAALFTLRGHPGIDQATLAGLIAYDRVHGGWRGPVARLDGGPGLRPRCSPAYYAAFVIDPSGHTIEAVRRVPDGPA